MYYILSLIVPEISPAIFTMIAINPTVTSDPAGDHSPPATDLPFAVIIFAIFILALAFHVLFVFRPHSLCGNILTYIKLLALKT
jgi:hypothetical protein